MGRRVLGWKLVGVTGDQSERSPPDSARVAFIFKTWLFLTPLPLFAFNLLPSQIAHPEAVRQQPEGGPAALPSLPSVSGSCTSSSGAVSKESAARAEAAEAVRVARAAEQRCSELRSKAAEAMRTAELAEERLRHAEVREGRGRECLWLE